MASDSLKRPHVNDLGGTARRAFAVGVVGSWSMYGLWTENDVHDSSSGNNNKNRKMPIPISHIQGIVIGILVLI